MPSILFEEQEIILLGKKPSVGKEPSSLVFPAAKADGDEKLVYFNISDRTSRFKKNQNGFCADSMLGLGTADVLVAASDEKKISSALGSRPDTSVKQQDMIVTGAPATSVDRQVVPAPKQEHVDDKMRLSFDFVGPSSDYSVKGEDVLLAGKSKEQVHKVKIKKEEGVLQLSDNSVNRRLDANGVRPLKLYHDPGFLERAFSRGHISSVYGGSFQPVFVNVSAQRVRDGITKYLGLKQDWNPHLPRVPGAGGLVLTRKLHPPGVSVPLFVCQDVNKWQYMGQYEMAAADPVSLDEWMQLPQQTRDIWYSRKIEFLSTDQGQDALNKILSRKAEGGGSQKITREDIDEAIETGDVVLTCSTIKCTSYNEGIQKNLIDPPFPSATPKSPKKAHTRAAAKQKAPNKKIEKPDASTQRTISASAVKKGVSLDDDEGQPKKSNTSNLSKQRRTRTGATKREVSKSEDTVHMRDTQSRRKRVRI